MIRIDPALLPALQHGMARHEATAVEDTNRIRELNWFNHRRLLEPIGNVPPAEAEARYYAQAEVQTLAA